MTPKEREAMQQALEALEAMNPYPASKETQRFNAITALQEALDHSGEADEMVGCAYCNNPLFAGTKCNNCGRITLAEQAEQDTMIERGTKAWADVPNATDWVEELRGNTEQAEQEPVCCETYGCAKPCPKYYAAPVRTKDLTDDEIEDVCCRLWSGGWRKKAMNDFARAVIEKFKEKNK